MRSAHLSALVMLTASLLSTPLFAQDTVAPNCDPLEGAVDLDHCPLRAGFCMLDDTVCAAPEADQLRSRARVMLGEKKLCQRFLREEFEYVKVDIEHHVPYEAVEASIFGSSGAFAGRLDIDSSVARIDADNDGASEYILAVRVPGSGPRPCDTKKFLPVGGDRVSLVTGRLMPMLSQWPECSWNIRPIRFAGRTYFETRTSIVGDRASKQQLLREVYMLHGASKDKVCEFRYR